MPTVTPHIYAIVTKVIVFIPILLAAYFCFNAILTASLTIHSIGFMHDKKS